MEWFSGPASNVAKIARTSKSEQGKLTMITGSSLLSGESEHSIARVALVVAGRCMAGCMVLGWLLILSASWTGNP